MYDYVKPCTPAFLEKMKAFDADLAEFTILLRKYYFSDSSKEIAASLNLTVSAVDTRAHRAILKLRSIFGGERVWIKSYMKF